MARVTLLLSLILTFSGSGTVRADWPFFTNDGPRRGSPEYYRLHANDPPGARQIYKDGKLWPPYPRPVGPHQLFVHKYHHTHYWPYPYTCEDRAATAAFVNVQVANGWLEQTTLYDYHFDPLTNELNSSGREHLRWILVHVPAEYRQVSVAVSEEPSKTGIRTSNVERAVAQMSGTNPGLVVVSRLADPLGRPASEVQSIFTSAQENMPPPILSQTAGEGGNSDN